MTDIEYLDAVAAMISDQEQAGLDIVSNRDYHLDPNLGGLSWILWPIERMAGVDPSDTYPAAEEWSYPPGSMLNEIVGGWRYPNRQHLSYRPQTRADHGCWGRR